MSGLTVFLLLVLFLVFVAKPMAEHREDRSAWRREARELDPPGGGRFRSRISLTAPDRFTQEEFDRLMGSEEVR